MSAILHLVNKLFFKKHHSECESVSYKTATSIGIIYSLDQASKFESINQFSAKFEHDGKQVSILTRLESSTTPNPNIDSFNKKDISIFGKWNNEKVMQFCAIKFDYLIFLDTKVTPIMENIIMRSKAKCRMGLYQEKKVDLFDLMIKVDGDLRFSSQLDEFFKYLVIIR